MITNLKLFLFPLLILLFLNLKPFRTNPLTLENFGKGWKFYLGDMPSAEKAAFGDANWRTLNVPSDWSIEGEFREKNNASLWGGALPYGIGW